MDRNSTEPLRPWPLSKPTVDIDRSGVLILKVSNRPSLGESSVSSLNGDTRGKKGPGDTMRTLVLTGGHKGPFVPTTSSLQTLACSENSLYSFFSPFPEILGFQWDCSSTYSHQRAGQLCGQEEPRAWPTVQAEMGLHDQTTVPHDTVPSAYSLGFPNI